MPGDNIVARLTALLGFRTDGKSERELTNSFERIKTFAAKAAASIGSLYTARKIFDFANSAASAADVIGKTARIFELSAEDFQKISFAAERVGVSTQKLQPSLRAITKRAAEAARGNKLYAESFHSLEVDVQNLDGSIKSTAELFRAVAEGVKNTKSPAERIRLLQNIADEAGPSLVNLFAGGTEALDAYGKELEGIGILTNEEVLQFEDFKDANENFNRSLTRLKSSIALGMLPTFKGLIDAFIAFRKRLPDKLVQNFGKILAAGAVALGVFAVGSVISAIAMTALGRSVARMAIPVFAAYLLFDELYTLFTGGDTIIGRVIDALWGPGSATEAVNAVKDSIASFIEYLRLGLALLWDFGQVAGKIFSGIAGIAAGRGFKDFKAITRDDFVNSFAQAAQVEATTASIDRGAGFDQAIEDAVKMQGVFNSPVTGAGRAAPIQKADVAINVETKTNASPADIGRAVSAATSQGIAQSFRRLRDAQVPATP